MGNELSPLLIAASIAGSYGVIWFSKAIENIKISSFFSWCGRNSLPLLCIHSLDYMIFIEDEWGTLCEKSVITMLYRVIADLFVLSCVTFISKSINVVMIKFKRET